MSADAFLAGYGAAQALPGPLFAFAALLGTVQGPVPDGWVGGLLATVAIFLPSFLLVFGALPFWLALRGSAPLRAALAGVNAAVVGLLLAALYDPVFTGAVHDGRDMALVLAAFALAAVAGAGVAGGARRRRWCRAGRTPMTGWRFRPWGGRHRPLQPSSETRIRATGNP